MKKTRDERIHERIRNLIGNQQIELCRLEAENEELKEELGKQALRAAPESQVQ